MELEIKIDPAREGVKVIIIADKVSDEINEMIRLLTNFSNGSGLGDGYKMLIAGFRDDTLDLIHFNDIYRIYASSGKVFAVTDQGEYSLRLRLYELEDRLDNRYFVRISNSEIINLNKVKNFDLSFRGTICVVFVDCSVTYVSRRYVSKIKKVLGM